MYNIFLFSTSLYFLILLSTSCISSNSDSNAGKNGTSVENKKNKYDTSLLRKCIPQKDTVIDENNSVQYVIVDSFYTVKLRIGGIDTLLNYRFNCSVPRGLVPTFYSSSQDMICLIRGSGQHYREFVIGYINSNGIIIKHYETALTTDIDNGIVVYQDYNERTKIIVENVRRGSQKVFKIPSIYITDIPISSIAEGKLKLLFSDENIVIFSLPPEGFK